MPARPNIHYRSVHQSEVEMIYKMIGEISLRMSYREGDDEHFCLTLIEADRFLASLGYIEERLVSPAELRRVWSMAVYQGKLFGGTLPSGHVWSVEAGKMATWDEGFPDGWHHVAAVKDAACLKLYVDGRQVAASGALNPGSYDLTTAEPLRIGFGAHEHFNGRMSDVRVYNRSFAPTEVAALASRPTTDA